MVTPRHVRLTEVESIGFTRTSVGYHIKYEKKLATDENQTHNFSDHSKRGYFYTFGIVSTIFNFKLSPTIWLDISTYHIGIVSAISV
jgi:hypothetical protein